MSDQIPPRLQEIIEDFQWSEGREKLELLLEYSEKMPSLPERIRQHLEGMERVAECMTPVLVTAEVQDGKMQFYFDVPRESPTVRGYAALISEGLRDLTPEEVLQVPNDFYHQMGLHEVLTHQRLAGISAILAHMKHLAAHHLTQSEGG
ncbi:MAG: SufE family protein [Chloroflexota bacterium]|nr:MAG: SufE family protein [Chloroflexota bacterium]